MLQDILQQTYYNNRVLDYLICLAAIIVGVLIVQIFKTLLLRRLKIWAEKTSTTVDDFLLRTIGKKLMPLFYLAVFYLSIRVLTLGERLAHGIKVACLVILTILGVRFLLALVAFGLETYWLKKEEDTSKINAIKGLLTVIRVTVWIVAFIILLDNLGVQVTTLVAGLGIGGIAIALAAQAILGDLFSYITIFFDRPFEIGDFIIVGDYMGTVEHIGIKTSRIRSLSGEEIVFSNTDLTNSRVRNYKRMLKRRVVFKLGVTYQTTRKQLVEIPAIIESIIKSMDDAVFDRSHFYSYGDFSLDVETVYYVIGRDYNKYMDIQQEINLKILEEFEKRGIEFAYPTQTLFIEKGEENTVGGPTPS